MSHALFSPSASERWLNCPGSVALTLGLPEQSSKYADEGTAAHTLANRALSWGKPASFWLYEVVAINGKDWTFTQEMCEYVQTYVDYVHATAKDTGAVLLTEQAVQLDKTLGIGAQWGTADVVLYAPETATLHVIDFKYGKGVKVEAGDSGPNTQLALYALGAIETITDLFGPVATIKLTIVQPRLDHISEYTLTYDELFLVKKGAQVAVRSAMMALTGRPEDFLHATEKGCRWCPVKATCPELQRKVAQELATEFESLAPVKLADSLADRYAQLELIEQYIGAVREATMNAITSGQAPVGPDGQPYKLVAGRGGHRAWKDAKTAGDVLTGLVGPAAYEPASVVSPAVADKLLNGRKKEKSAMWNDFIAPLVYQPPGKPVIVLGSDERPNYMPATAEEFECLTT